MIKLSNIKMKPKLMGLFLMVGLIPLIIVGIWSSQQASKALMRQSFNQLNSVGSIKKAQIEKYFAERQGDMGVLVDTVGALRDGAFRSLDAVHDARMAQLHQYFDEALNGIDILAQSQDVEELYNQLLDYHNRTKVQPDGPYDVNTAEYENIWSHYGKQIQLFQETFGFYDVFMICAAHGHVMYSTAKESDLGTNLHNGPYRDSGLNKIWDKTIKNRKRSVVDFSPYAPSNGEPAAFVGVPLFLGDQLRGVMVVQLSPDRINEIMSLRTGLGKTGESYLVGPDYLMRSDSYLDPVNRSLKASFANPDKGQVDTDAVRNALAGTDGEDVILDYNGNPVLSVFAPFKVMDLTWAIIAEMDMAEAFSPVDEQGKEFYAKYIEKYGYYDLFLIDSSGYVFYTVTKEADYQTNMVAGKYASSNLGELTRTVLKTKQYGVVDFKPYAPSNGTPAAFIAQPVVDSHDNELEMIIAMQLPLEGINHIMQLREGLGDTGEAYLVGPDKLMRSDSFLDKDGHSVTASFAGTVEQNGVDTEASRRALNGESGAQVIMDYNGNPVLSAYTPVQVGSFTWALLAEIDEAEVQAPIKSIIMSITLIACVIAVLVALLAFLVARQIALPLAKAVAFAKTLSEKDLTQKLEINQKDEIGILGLALNEMAENLSVIIKNIAEKSEDVADASHELAENSTAMSQGAEQTSDKSNLVAAASEEMSTNMNTVAAAMEETTTNTNMVAASSEEMSSTIAEIAENTARVDQAVRNSVTQAQSASERVAELEKSAFEINKVTEVIAGISSQTNLLALNATIEAARAGEAGRGFAVVATEIKALAGQTAAATEEITKEINDIQQSTQVTIKDIKEIASTINEISEMITTISAAVEEQSVTTREMAGSVAQTSQAIVEVNENIGQASSAIQEITLDITSVSGISTEMLDNSSKVKGGSTTLSEIAKELKKVVNTFKV